MQLQALKHKRKFIIAFAIISSFGITVLFLFVPAGASATTITGNITLSSSNVFDQATDVITLTNLAPSTAYALYIGTTNISGNFTTGTNPQPIPFYPTISMPATGSTVTVYLYSAATTVDTATIGVTGVQSIIPFNLLVNIGIMLFILFIIAAILREFMRRRGESREFD